MSAPLRIGGKRAKFAKQALSSNPAKEYLERLLKLIPAEIVALYLAGRTAILKEFPENATSSAALESRFWIGWTIFCLAAIFLVRIWATGDKMAGLKPQWPAVLIAASSFLIWVYNFGDVFRVLGLWNQLLAILLMLGWTFLVPLFYKGSGQ